MEIMIYKEVTFEELPSIHRAMGCMVIDVRTELEQQIIRNPFKEAIHIPLHDEELVERENFLKEVLACVRNRHGNPADAVVAFICRSRERSQRACELMIRNTPYKNIYNVKDGILT